MPEHDLTGYIKLIEEFNANNVSALTFEQKYLEMFKNDETQFLQTEYEVLNNLFTDVDAFCADDSLRDADNLNEPQLESRREQHSEHFRAYSFKGHGPNLNERLLSFLRHPAVQNGSEATDFYLELVQVS